MFALVDCNSFFCSVEKVFHPGLRGKPVCVLSNNDGCIVALTSEAKALGLRRGDPLFKVSGIVEVNGVRVFSSNMMLYNAMSRRVTNILRKSVCCVDNYSIDESFCDLTGYEAYYDLEEFMRGLADKIRTWTDVPVSVGVAPTKTLAKMGSKFAKKYPGYRSVCMIDTERKRRKALSLSALEDIWGIGRATLRQLTDFGVVSPLGFADKRESWVRSRFPLPVLRTWKELNGIPCIDTHEVMCKQTICTSRSFGEMVGDLQHLREAVATFASGCANKLRGQRAVAGSVTVFISSNRFREDLPMYRNSMTMALPVKTSDTMEITQASMRLLEMIYRPAILYKKAGVVVGDIAGDACIEQYLYDKIHNRKQRHGLMKTIDQINQAYGVKTVYLGTEGIGKQPWHVKCEQKSANYLTDVQELLTIHV